MKNYLNIGLVVATVSVFRYSPEYRRNWSLDRIAPGIIEVHLGRLMILIERK